MKNSTVIVPAHGPAYWTGTMDRHDDSTVFHRACPSCLSGLKSEFLGYNAKMTCASSTDLTRIIAWNVARLTAPAHGTATRVAVAAVAVTGRRGRRGPRPRLGPRPDVGLRSDAGPRRAEDCLEDCLDNIIGGWII